MTPEQLAVIESTLEAVVEDGDAFAARFYGHLFELAPETRELFPSDLAEQRAKLVDELVFLARAATDLSAFTTRAQELGARHHHYGVRPHHYARFEEALHAAMVDTLGSRYTDEARRAWGTLHRLVSETMLEGAAGELFTPR